MSVDVIDLSGNVFRWEKTLIDVDRTARPLTITGGTFTGPGVTSEGIFFLGMNAYTANVTLVGQTYDGVTLASSGAIEVRSGDRLTIRDQTFRNLRRDPYWSPNPYNSWGIYISGANRVIRDLLIDVATFERPPVNRDLSAIQIDSSSLSHGAVTIRNVTMTGYAFAFYENVTTNPLTLDTWSITDTSRSGVAVSFHKATGTYRAISLVNSGVISVNQSGMVAQ
jgi:hypothetical protein